MKNDLGDVTRIRECYSPAEANQILHEGRRWSNEKWELAAIESVDVPEGEGRFLRRLVYVFVLRETWSQVHLE